MSVKAKVEGAGRAAGSDTLERRIIRGDARIQKRADGKPMLVGHFAVYDQLSEDLGGFTEMIRRGAFADVLKSDVRALFNHDSNLVLGRSTAGTLRMFDDAVGVRYECDLPDTQVARDLAVSVERGDVTGCSFSFRVKEQRWTFRGKDEPDLREIIKFEELYDVGPVTFPAYPQTDVAMRCREQARQEESRKADRPRLRDAELAIAQAELD